MKTAILLLLVLLLGAGCSLPSPAKKSVESSAVQEEDARKVSSVIADIGSQEIPETERNVARAEEAVETSATPVVEIGKKLYSGWWFDIQYPADFIARPMSPSLNLHGADVGAQTDEAYYQSPDGTVEFYVYSPQWGGEPEYLELRSNEVLADDKSEKSGPEGNMRIVRWVTVKDSNGGYFRSFVDIREQVGSGSDLRHVFGIQYTSSDAYNRYRDEYIAFKNSLLQYAD